MVFHCQRNPEFQFIRDCGNWSGSEEEFLPTPVGFAFASLFISTCSIFGIINDILTSHWGVLSWTKYFYVLQLFSWTPRLWILATLYLNAHRFELQSLFNDSYQSRLSGMMQNNRIPEHTWTYTAQKVKWHSRLENEIVIVVNLWEFLGHTFHFHQDARTSPEIREVRRWFISIRTPDGYESPRHFENVELKPSCRPSWQTSVHNIRFVHQTSIIKGVVAIF